MDREPLDVQRMTYAVETVFDACGGLPAGYRQLVAGAGMLLRRAGLLGFAAYFAAKGGAHRRVLDHVTGWLARSPATGWMLGRAAGREPVPPDVLIRTLCGLPAQALAALQDEALEIVSYLKRMAEAAENRPQPPTRPRR